MEIEYTLNSRVRGQGGRGVVLVILKTKSKIFMPFYVTGGEFE